MPVSIRTHRAPTARAAARSVPIPSPIITASLGVTTDRLGRELEQMRLGLADRQRRDPGRRLERRGDRAGSGSKPAFGRIDRVAVRRDEACPGPHAVGRGGEPRYVRFGSSPDTTASGAPAAVQPSIPSWCIRVAACAAVTTSRPTSRSSRSSPPAPTASTRRMPVSWLTMCSAVARADVTTRSGEIGAPIAAEARHVVGPVVHRVVRDVHDVVALGSPIGEDRSDTRDGFGAAIHDAVEVDEQQQAHATDRSRGPAGAYDQRVTRPRDPWPPPTDCSSTARTSSRRWPVRAARFRRRR